MPISWVSLEGLNPGNDCCIFFKQQKGYLREGHGTAILKAVKVGETKLPLNTEPWKSKSTIKRIGNFTKSSILSK